MYELTQIVLSTVVQYVRLYNKHYGDVRNYYHYCYECCLLLHELMRSLGFTHFLLLL